MAKDEWLTAAMTDDGMVVELLMRLKQAKATPVSTFNPAVIPLKWGIRQPRSRLMRCDAVSVRNEADSTKNARCSPTTPLSWSGGGGSASPSAVGDSYEETSRHSSGAAAVGSRSKVLALDETNKVGTKRFRRKKTFAELKEEESVLLNERMCLKKEIATLRTTYKEQSLRNENLKRMKIDLDLNCTKHLHSTCNGNDREIPARTNERLLSSPEQEGTSMSGKNASACELSSRSDACHEERADIPRDGSYLLPDLNMLPSEDNYPEVLHGTS